MNWGNLLFSFNGRVGRKAFWLYVLASFLVGILINVVALGPMIAAAQTNPEALANMSMPIWVWIVFIPLIWIGLAIQAKRWHDQDKSAWWILIGLIPFVGGLIVLVMCGFMQGTPGPNRFGDGPMT
ncbi:MAG: DUF805 domain-containing protein [Lysobacteraceae bacterium]